jgi:hypothetical protein
MCADFLASISVGTGEEGEKEMQEENYDDLVEEESDEKVIEKPLRKDKGLQSKKEYNKNWYEKNKEKHIAYCLEKVVCTCGRKISRSAMSYHKRSKIHAQELNDRTMNDYRKKYQNIKKKYLKLKTIVEKCNDL